MAYVTSKDGTKIAYTKTGSGPALIIVDGALCYREFGPSKQLSEKLKDKFTVFSYDRRGRGESGDSKDYEPMREVEDLEVLIDEAGGHAALFGQSSGGALVLEAANHLGKKVESFAMYEDPFFVDNTRSSLPDGFIAEMKSNIAAGKRGQAVKMFMKLVGTPSFMVAIMPIMPMWSKLEAVAHTLPYDFSFMAEHQQGTPLKKGEWPNATQPALAGVGGKSPKWMQNSMHQVNDVLKNSSLVTLPGQTHMVKADVLVPELEKFFTSKQVSA